MNYSHKFSLTMRSTKITIVFFFLALFLSGLIIEYVSPCIGLPFSRSHFYPWISEQHTFFGIHTKERSRYNNNKKVIHILKEWNGNRFVISFIRCTQKKESSVLSMIWCDEIRSKIGCVCVRASVYYIEPFNECNVVCCRFCSCWCRQRHHSTNQRNALLKIYCYQV